MPLAKFLTHLTDESAFVPHGFLTNFEMSRLTIDTYGSLFQQNQEKEQMIVAFFLFSKILVAQILMQSDIYAGMKTEGNPSIKSNLKVIASFIQNLILDYFT